MHLRRLASRPVQINGLNVDSCSPSRINVSAIVVTLIGIALHAAYVLAMFDIYFRSPLVHGMTPQVSLADPPAKRVVLFVGLRKRKAIILFARAESFLFR